MRSSVFSAKLSRLLQEIFILVRELILFSDHCRLSPSWGNIRRLKVGYVMHLGILLRILSDKFVHIVHYVVNIVIELFREAHKLLR